MGQLKQALALVLRGGEVDGRQIPGMDQLKGGIALLTRGGIVGGQQLPGLGTTYAGLDSALTGSKQLAGGLTAHGRGSAELSQALSAIQSKGELVK